MKNDDIKKKEQEDTFFLTRRYIVIGLFSAFVIFKKHPVNMVSPLRKSASLFFKILSLLFKGLRFFFARR